MRSANLSRIAEAFELAGYEIMSIDENRSTRAQIGTPGGLKIQLSPLAAFPVCDESTLIEAIRKGIDRTATWKKRRSA